MSTNSRIGMIKEDGTVESIYCHYDGYYEYNGVLLYSYYQDIDKIEKLIRLGSISCLQPKVEPAAHEKHSFSEPQEDVVIAYHRDCGEKLCKIQHNSSVQELFNETKGMALEYIYLYDERNGEWLIMNHYSKENCLTSLEEKLKELELIEVSEQKIGGMKQCQS